MKLKVTFTHTATGYTKSSYAFYDGTQSNLRDIIRFRASLSLEGPWTYSLACEAGDCLAGSGLTNTEVLNRNLMVTSLQSPSTNALFTKGHLGIYRQPPPLGGTILYENNERFYWIGDSAWAAPLRAEPSEWKRYIDDRKSRGVTVVQIGIAPEWAGGCIEDELNPSNRKPPFSNQPTGNNCLGAINGVMPPPGDEAQATSSAISATIYPTSNSLPVPHFWNRFERMIQYANCQGIVVLVAGVAEPISRYPVLANLKPFARNLAARLSGNAVILSPGFDDDITATCSASPNLAGSDLLLREVGKELASTAPHLLTTNHFGTMGGDPNNNEHPYTGNSSAHTLDRICSYRSYSLDPWMDLWLGQTGENSNRLERTTERPRTLMAGLRGITDPRFSIDRRPVINAEAIYDHGDAADGNPRHTNRFRSRQANWLSWTSGALGYTFGTMGVWEWGICGTNLPPGGRPSFCNKPGMTHTNHHDHYAEAMIRPSSSDITQLKDLLIGHTQWWKLITTEQSRIKNQPIEADPHVEGGFRLAQDKLMTVVRDSNWVVAYMPHDASIALDLTGLPFCTSPTNPLGCHATFYSPRSGVLSVGTSGIATPGQPRKFVFSNPEGLGTSGDDDWVLGINRTTSASLGWSLGSTNRFEARPSMVARDGSMALVGQLVDANGVELSAGVEVSDRVHTIPFAPRVARDGTGRFVLAWQEHQDPAVESRVWLRRLDAAGNPVGAQFSPSSSNLRAQNISVASDSEGRFVAVWEDWSSETERFEVQLRTFDSNGSPLMEALSLSTARMGKFDEAPIVACDPAGACLAAWERRDADKEAAALWLSAFSLSAPWNAASYEYRPASNEILSLDLLVAKAPNDFELSFERQGGGGESLGVTGTRLNASALPVGTEYTVRGPWLDQ